MTKQKVKHLIYSVYGDGKTCVTWCGKDETRQNVTRNTKKANCKNCQRQWNSTAKTPKLETKVELNNVVSIIDYEKK